MGFFGSSIVAAHFKSTFNVGHNEIAERNRPTQEFFLTENA